MIRLLLTPAAIILINLESKGPQTITQLLKNTKLNTQTLYNNLRKLQIAKLVEYNGKHYYITEKGRKALSQLRNTIPHT